MAILFNMLLGALAGWFFGYFVVFVLLGGPFWAMILVAMIAGFAVGMIDPGGRLFD